MDTIFIVYSKGLKPIFMNSIYVVGMSLNRSLMILSFILIIFSFYIAGYSIFGESEVTYPDVFEFTHVGIEEKVEMSTCLKCHEAPIREDCETCHSNLEPEINSIYFPHHNATITLGNIYCTNSLCHPVLEGDVRFVKKPLPDHNYCSNCHELSHSSP
jgi:hypothetical protein